MIGSVRARLTVVAAIVVGAVAVAAALLAPRSVEQALIDDRLDAEVPAERAALDGQFVTVTSTNDSLGSPQLTALFGPDIADLAASLDAAGVLDRLRSFRSDGSLLVVPIPGVIGEIDAAFASKRISARHRLDELEQLLDGSASDTFGELRRAADKLDFVKARHILHKLGEEMSGHEGGTA